VQVTYGAPHHLVADGGPYDVRRSAAGDAWQRRQEVTAAGAAAAASATVVPLGLPRLRPATDR
jgi:tRNA-2-methylthio-N6-dimethylallyladenosine synthase